MNDDPIELASAYLDGDVTPDERAIVEASPDLLAEVEQLRLVRGLLADVEPSAISAREEHLAAALAAWDRLPDVERIAAVRDSTPAGVDGAAAAGASAVTTTRPSSLADRRRARNRNWTLAAAAGLVAVLAGGIVVNQLADDGNDDQSADLSSANTEAPAAEPASEPEEIAIEAAEEFDRVEADEPAQAQAEPEPANDSAEEVEADQVPQDAEAPPPEDDVIQLNSPDDLALFAGNARGATSGAIDEPASGETASDEGGFDLPTCSGIESIVGVAQYVDELVVVGLTDGGNVAVANSLDDCGEVARTQLP
ncbi:MAG: hypothetical protein ACR2O6_03605 [Ilumatobacteraceae bacterium]